MHLRLPHLKAYSELLKIKISFCNFFVVLSISSYSVLSSRKNLASKYFIHYRPRIEFKDIKIYYIAFYKCCLSLKVVVKHQKFNIHFNIPSLCFFLLDYIYHFVLKISFVTNIIEKYLCFYTD